MKALSLTQPWAQLICIGAKSIETRSFWVSYRGPLAIHASKGFPRYARDFHYAMVCQQFGIPIESLPLGAVVATCRLVDCIRTEELVPQRNCGYFSLQYPEVSDQEQAFGDYGPSRFGWLLEDVKLLPVPIPAKGALGLWEWNGA